ncbi:MAG: hypothetical protein Q4B43_08770 [Bacteroidota bacterium]|nr:hypothetical protein [Bacteroidota bacterium]
MKSKYDLFLSSKIIDISEDVKMLIPIEIWWKKQNDFLGLELSLEQAKELKKHLEKAQIMLKIIPILYKNPKITFEKAKNIAFNEYSKVKSANINRYGDFKIGSDHPIWYSFFSDDYTLQEQGYTPGYWGVYVDKLTGNIMGNQEIIHYLFL